MPDGVIVTPVKVAAMATANLTVRVKIGKGEPVALSWHPGSFVDMTPESAPFDIPAYYVDAIEAGDGGTWWLSAELLHEKPEFASTVLQALVHSSKRIAAPVAVEGREEFAELLGYLAAALPGILSTASLPDGRGVGAADVEGAALLVGSELVYMGERSPLQGLHEVLERWRENPVRLSGLGYRIKAEADGWRLRPALR